LSDQKKQPKSTDSKVIIGDVKKSLKEQNKLISHQNNTPKPSIDNKDVIAVNAGSHSKQLLNRIILGFKRHKIGLFFGIVLTIVVISSSVLGFVFIQNSSPAIKVNGESISIKQYQKFKIDNEKTKHSEIIGNDFQNYIVQALVYKSAAKDFDIKYSSDDINQKIGDIFGLQQSTYSDWQKFVAETEINKSRLQATDVKEYFAHFVFPFSSHFATGYSEAPIKDLGNQSKIDSDKQYAKTEADKYLKAVRADNTLANNQKLVAQVIADKRLNYGFTGNNSEVFGYLPNGAKNSSLDNNRYPSQKEIDITKNLTGTTDIMVVTHTGVSNLPGYNSGDVPIAYEFYSKPSSNNKIFNYDDFYKNARITVNVKN
jgi:hypothetical protein